MMFLLKYRQLLKACLILKIYVKMPGRLFNSSILKAVRKVFEFEASQGFIVSGALGDTQDWQLLEGKRLFGGDSYSSEVQSIMVGRVLDLAVERK